MLASSSSDLDSRQIDDSLFLNNDDGLHMKPIIENVVLVEDIATDSSSAVVSNPHQHPNVIDEIRSQFQTLRRRRSFDTDHLQQQHDAANNKAPPVQRQFSHHLNCNHFQDEVLKACHLLQQDADEEEERRGLLPDAVVTYVVDETNRDHIHRIVSPPPPSIASHHFSDDERQRSYITSPLPPANGCKPCWLLAVIYFWLFSPSRVAYFARVAGITAAVLSAFFSSLNYAISEYLEGSFDPVEIFAWRQTLMIAFCFPITAYYQKPMYFKRSEAKLWWPMTVRSIGSAFAVLFVYFAIEFIPLSDATVVSNSAPIFCSFIARIFLKEPFGIAEILCAIAVFCGVTLNAQPAWLFDFSLFTADLQKRLIGLAFALGGALATASTTVIMRTMKSVHFSTQQLMFGYISTLLTWPVAFFMGVARLPPCGGDKIIMLASGFTAVPAQALLIYACQNEKAGIVSLARSTMPVFSLIFQITLFGILPDIYSIMGNIIILGAILSLAFKMLLEQKKKTKAMLSTPVQITDGDTICNKPNFQHGSNLHQHNQHYAQLMHKSGSGGNNSNIFSFSHNCNVTTSTTFYVQSIVTEVANHSPSNNEKSA